MFINHTTKQVAAKIVYYGPGLGGKTTNLRYIFSVTSSATRGELVCMETETERTLFFDLLPINVGLIKGYQAKFQLYTVPGQIFYDSTRRLVLKGADGIVFVADSQSLMEQANIDSMENLKTNLSLQGQNIGSIPLVIQYNKRDLKNITPVEQMNATLNPTGCPWYEAISKNGTGVIETLREISSLTLIQIRNLIETSEKLRQAKPRINFDTDASRKILEDQELPLKTIQAESFDTFAPSVRFEDEVPTPPASQPPPPPQPPPAPIPQAVAPAAVKSRPEEKLPQKQSAPAEPQAPPPPPPSEPAPRKQKVPSSHDLLEGLSDKTRITLIRKIKTSADHLTLHLQGEDLSEEIPVSLDPKTRKITLILDVEH